MPAAAGPLALHPTALHLKEHYHYLYLLRFPLLVARLGSRSRAYHYADDQEIEKASGCKMGEELGRGAFGIVYKAVSAKYGVCVAATSDLSDLAQ
jgi:hypothetical protein